MSIFNQKIEVAATTGLLQPGSDFWEKWVVNNTVTSVHNPRISLCLDGDILAFDEAHTYPKLKGKLGIREYLPDINGVECNNRVYCQGIDNEFLTYDDQFLLKSENLVFLEQAGVMQNLTIQTDTLHLIKIKNLINTDLSDAHSIISWDWTKFNNCKFAPGIRVYFEIRDFLRLNEYNDQIKEFCDYMYKFTGVNGNRDVVNIYAQPVPKIHRFDIYQMFGIPDNVRFVEISLPVKDSGCRALVLDCIPSYKYDDQHTRDGFAIVYFYRF